MGLLSKTLAPQSSYAARKAGLWDELIDELAGCFFPGAVDDFEDRCRARGLEIPGAYETPLADAIEARREELRSEDIGTIVRDRFDF
jgi:hypothetical protein